MATKEVKTPKVTKTAKEAKVSKSQSASESKVTKAAGDKKPGGATGTRSALSVPMYALTGKAAGSLALPKEIFGAKVNSKLLSQALRVYLNNQKGHYSNTKTRGEVQGSTRKIYKQKGTGRARHGGITAPIFVGGGIALGPKSRVVTLELPKKMRQKALIAALSQKTAEKLVIGVDDLTKSTGKTKEMAAFISGLDLVSKDRKKNRSALIVVGEAEKQAFRAVKNLTRVDLLPADQLNAYEVIKHQVLVMTRAAVEKLLEKTQRIAKEKAEEPKRNVK